MGDQLNKSQQVINLIKKLFSENAHFLFYLPEHANDTEETIFLETEQAYLLDQYEVGSIVHKLISENPMAVSVIEDLMEQEANTGYSASKNTYKPPDYKGKDN